MIAIGGIVVFTIFLVVGWAVFTEMFNQRAWRRRVARGDLSIIAALLEEAMAGWRSARPAKGVPAGLWAGVQAAQLVAVAPDGATVSTSAEPEFQSRDGRRVQTASALDAAIAIAAKLADMLLYDVPNLRLGFVRVDVYSTFTGEDGQPVQKPVLTTTAERAVADELQWDALMPAEILARFDTTYVQTPSGQCEPVTLPPVAGTSPAEIPPPGAVAPEGSM